MSRTVRRLLGAGMVIAGALLMWLAPNALLGVLLMGGGIALEVIGISLERRR